MPLPIKHTNFWDMAREIRAYCKETGLQVLSADDRTTMTLGFVTALPEEDPKYRNWRIRFADVSRTANKREGEIDGQSVEVVGTKYTALLMGGLPTRKLLAEALSTGVLPSP